jgi:zeaxanthin glucosyltransferase
MHGPKLKSVGLEFIAVGERDFPAGSMAGTTAQLGQLGGLSAIRFTAELLRRAAVTILAEAPEAIAAAKIDALLVDQVTPAGDTVAELLRLPFVLSSSRARDAYSRMCLCPGA